MALSKARLLERPNRFILYADDGGVKKLYLANPGRLKELIFRGVELLYEPASNPNTDGTVVAIKSPHFGWVPLHTGRANNLAEDLLRSGRWQGLEDWSVERREVKVGDSRFDFALRRGDEVGYGEVKCCTLFAGQGAYFPDAPSERAVKHLRGLARLKVAHQTAFVLPLVMNGAVRWWCPDWHTDIAFARALAETATVVPILPMALGFDEHLAVTEARSLALPLDFLRTRLVNWGWMVLTCQGEDRWSWVGYGCDDLDKALRTYHTAAKKLLPQGKITAWPLRSLEGLGGLLSRLGGEADGHVYRGGGAGRLPRSFVDSYLGAAFVDFEPQVIDSLAKKSLP